MDSSPAYFTAMNMYDCLFADVTLLSPERHEPLEHAWVGVCDGKITYVGAAAPDGTAAKTVQGEQLVLIPGLINAHSHVAMTALRGYADDVKLQSWLFDHIFPAEAKLDAEGVALAARLGMMESLSCGVTGLCDMYFCSDVVCDEAVRTGMRVMVSNAATRFGEGPLPPEDRTLTEFEAILERYPDHPMVRTVSGIHAVYTSNPETREQMLMLAQKYDMPILLHLSETETENRECMEKYGMSPTELLEKEGILDVPVVAAHCVHLSARDREILREHGVVCVHNPVSNCKLASGIADIAAMENAGLTIALGTDGVASNNNHDLFEEMKLMALLGKVKTGDASAVSAHDAFRAATMGGAAAMGRADCAGQIRVGFDADLAVLDFDQPHLQPMHNVLSSLVYAASGRDVVLTMNNGRIVYENGRFPGLDEKETAAQLREYVKNRLSRA